MMRTHTVMSSRNGVTYHYYTCKQRKQHREACYCTQKAVRASEAEQAVWGFVSDFLRDPEEIRRGMERLIERERMAQNGDLEHETEIWACKIAEYDRRRSAYQDQQAAGLMTDELGSKLTELENARTSAERELVALKDHQRRVEEIEKDRDALLESMAGMLPEALDCLSGEEKNRIYRMLRLEVIPTPHGYEVSGAFGTRATSW